MRREGRLVCLALSPALVLALSGAAQARGEEAAHRLDLLPRLLATHPPTLPAAAAQKAGVVVLDLEVDPFGRVAALEVAVSSGDSELDQAAIEAAKKFVYSPGRIGERSVTARVTYRMRFPWGAKAAQPPVVAPAATAPVAAPAATAPAVAPTATSAAAPAASPTPAESPAPSQPTVLPAGVPFVGVVLEKGTREPLPGIRVALEAPKGTSLVLPEPLVTDAEGRFSFPSVPPGELNVRLSGPRVRLQSSTEKLNQGKKTQVTYYVFRDGDPFRTVVRGDKVRKDIVEQVLDVAELKRIPGTQNDAIKAVQNLPGVARAPFGGGLLVVWGSAPGDTRVYADGLRVPRIYHFGGFRSTINSEFVSELSFRPGAYGADYGRGLGGIINVTTRAPKADRLHGSVTLDLIDGSVTLEGPLTKKLHFAVGARVSWISVFLPIFNRSQFQVSPFYWDYQVALRYKPTSRDELDLFVFGSTDILNARVENPDPAVSLNIDTKNYFGRARLRYTHRFSPRTSLMVMPSLGGEVTRFDTGEGIAGRQLRFDLQGLGYNLRAEVRHQFLPNLEGFVGLDFEGTRVQVDVVAPPFQGGTGGEGGRPNPAAAQSLRDGTTFHLLSSAPYAIANFSLFSGRLLLSPQLRLAIDYYRSYNGEAERTQVLPEPRMMMQVAVIPRRLFLRLGAGLFHQVPQGNELSRTFGNPNLDWQYGATYVFGAEGNLTETLYVQSQLFYKDLRSLVVTEDRAKVGIPYSNGGLGRVYGADFLVRQRLWKGLFGWVAYTLSRSERRDRPEEDWRIFVFDQTHILTLVASYKLPFWGLEVGLRFRYVTGNPTTPVLYGVRNIDEQGWESVLGPRNSGRLPDFHQLDLRVDKTFTFNRWRLGIYLDIQNLYNQPNTETLVFGGRQLYQEARVTGIPIFPNIGVRADF